MEEQKIAQQEKKDQDLIEQMSQLSLLEEIEKCKQEMGGPFFNKRENQRHRQEQEQIRMQEEMRGMRGGGCWGPAAKMQTRGG